MDCSPPGSSVHWILQARILEWVAISFSRGSSWPRDWTQDSWIAGRFFTIRATGKSQSHSVVSHSLWPHELYSPWNSPGQNTRVGNLPLFQEIEPRSPTLQADSFTSWATRDAQEYWSGQPIPSSANLPYPGIEGNSKGLLHCRRILYQLSHKRSPRILELVAYPFSNRSSQPRELDWCLLYCRWIPY